MEWLIHVLECISLQYYKDSDVKYLHAFIDWLECGDCITSISQIIKPCLGCFSSICPGSFALILMGYSQQSDKPPIIYTVFGAVEETAYMSELNLLTVNFLASCKSLEII